MRYLLCRGGIIYEILIQRHYNSSFYYCEILLSNHHITHAFSSLEKSLITEYPNGYRFQYQKYDSKTHDPKIFSQFLQHQDKDVWKQKWEEVIVNSPKNYFTEEDDSWKKIDYPNHFLEKISLDNPVPSTNPVYTPPKPSSHWPGTKKLFIFGGLFLLSLILLSLTILTSGAAAGILIPGAAGFLNAIPFIIPLGVLPGFAVSLSLAITSALLSAMSLVATVRVFYIDKLENLFRKKLNKKSNHPPYYQKMAQTICMSLLALGLLLLCGWAIASTVGILAVPAIAGIILGSLSGGFLSTAGGIAVLIGTIFSSAILSTYTMSSAISFAKNLHPVRKNTSFFEEKDKEYSGKSFDGYNSDEGTIDSNSDVSIYTYLFTNSPSSTEIELQYCSQLFVYCDGSLK